LKNPLDWLGASLANGKYVPFQKLHDIRMAAARCPVKSSRVALISRHHGDAIRVLINDSNYQIHDCHLDISPENLFKQIATFDDEFISEIIPLSLDWAVDFF
jgi:hypothetical protein